MALVAAAALAACSGGGAVTGNAAMFPTSLTTPGTTPAPFPFVAGPPPPAGVCNALLVNDPKLALVFPANGATGVSTTVGSITFTAARLYYTLVLVPSDGSATLVGGPITALATAGAYVSALPPLKPGMKYDIAIYPSSTLACAYFPGAFTTQ